MRPHEKPSPSIIAGIPPHLLNAMEQYIYNGIPPGDFITACFENNLSKAVMFADDNSMRSVKNIVKYIFNYTPHLCHGSTEAVRCWLRSSIEERDELTAHFKHCRIQTKD